MILFKWLRPGVGIKRWIFLGMFGVFMLSLGIAELTDCWFSFSVYTLISLILILSGTGIIFYAFKMGLKAVILLLNDAGVNFNIDVDKLESRVNEKRLLVRGPKIVAIGGGTGLSTMLRGLKYYTSNITAIVTVADDGGSSGMLREELGILPPGDIRNCLLALADTEPVMQELLQYRFTTEGSLKDQSFGNLFIAAMNGISGSFEEAIKKMSDVLAVTGKVLPVTLSNIRLLAELENGFIIEGESKISKREQYREMPIKRVFIEPAIVSPLDDAIKAINEADAIILGPGSLYTSIIPNLLVNGIAKHIEDTSAVKIYVANIMTQPGETIGYTLSDHIETIKNYFSKNIIDYVIVNNGKIPNPLYDKYIEDGASEVAVDKEKLSSLGVNIVEDDFVSIHNNLLRHNSKKLAFSIMELILDKKISRKKAL